MSATRSEIGLRRLANQRLIGPPLERPEDVVAWMGALQAQDYPASLWAVGARMGSSTEEAVEAALIERRIVRTWPTRGTLHLVAAEDTRWMLNLLAPRAIAAAAGRLRQLELDASTLERCRDVVTKSLEGGRHLTRDGLYAVLTSAGIPVTGQRGIHVVWFLAHVGLVCFGARIGKQHTYVLLDEWLPPTPVISRDQALAEISRRYFSSHGPATVRDLVWWSGLTTADVRSGIALARDSLRVHIVGTTTYYSSASEPDAPTEAPEIEILPAFDEFLVGYRDREAVLDPAWAQKINPGGGLLSPVVVRSGRVVGTWRRVLADRRVTVTVEPFEGRRGIGRRGLLAASGRYAVFLGRSLILA